MSLILASTQDLITELVSRYDHIALVGLREGYVGDKQLRTLEYRGDTIVVAGLLCQLQAMVIEDGLSEAEEYDG
jgi:hypothetical protein